MHDRRNLYLGMLLPHGIFNRFTSREVNRMKTIERCELCAEPIKTNKIKDMRKYFNGKLVCANCWYREKKTFSKEGKRVEVKTLRYLMNNSTLI